MAEKEYIEREALLENLHKFAPEHNTRLIQLLVTRQPTADVTDIVRCKDCTHRYVPARCALWVGNENGKDIFLERGDDFFCKYGERKE